MMAKGKLPSTIPIRVDNEVYAAVLSARGKLEAATGGWVPIGKACAFLLVALSQMGAATA